MTLSWNEQLEQSLINQYGNKKGKSLSHKYKAAFNACFIDNYPIDIAVSDIAFLETLNDTKRIALTLYHAKDAQYPLHLRLFQWKNPIPLSDILPILENLNLRVYDERPHKILLQDKTTIWVSDFSLTYFGQTFQLTEINELFQSIFTRINNGETENDGFNKLILGASLSWREILIFRVYAKYLRQIGFRFTQPYIENALLNHPAITKNLIQLFNFLHDPKNFSQKSAEKIEETILNQLEQVSSLDEDRIIREILMLIKATLRTNYFQKEEAGDFKEAIAIKLNSKAIINLPLPKPLFEIFVYSTKFEGIHLRSEKVARGGIRWSDRREDFRTEILGLMKAQKVKNSVIVPSGAKGGFVLKKPTSALNREALQKEVIAAYSTFISSLLDLTDNLKNKQFIPPKNTVCHDEPDPYLVVAADKGTATFSDLANDIAHRYHFWLGDAFASGGSMGYDHKKMGITAKGAWESIKRHFRELEIDCMKTMITVVGIGDMSGDVFGNGMIYTNTLKLIAAFDHRHIFIDPTPNPEKSYKERLRLYQLATSSWEDYNAKLISKGGGVFKRNLKSITLTPEMKKIFAVDNKTATPNELISIILKAPVDLLFNGGIGTYVKASTESHADVGDRSNDYTRIDASELRCKVVGEGGNLGFTQLGRVEYALNQGLINTDFIDNSAGVDCSDHEVNLKILLSHEISNGHLTFEKRNRLLASLTDEIAALVLKDNYAQALLLSFSAYHAEKNIGLHISYLKMLIDENILDIHVEFLPDEKKLMERKAAGIGLTKPELAVLLAYTKIHLKNALLASNLTEDPYLKNWMMTAFPPTIQKKYVKIMSEHKLHREIIATQLSNDIINEMGFTFIYRLQMETGAIVADIIKAHAIASHIFGTKELRGVVESLDFKLTKNEQYDILYNIRTLVNLATRWFIHSNYLKKDLAETINHFSKHVKILENIIPNLMAGLTKDYLRSLSEKFKTLGLPKESAERIATYRAIYTSLNIIDIATIHRFDLIKTAEVYFASGEKINLLWFRDQIANDSREGHWNALARLTLRDELDVAQRTLTIEIMKKSKNLSSASAISSWFNKNKEALNRWDRLLTLLHSSSNLDYTMFFIAIRELLGLIINAA